MRKAFVIGAALAVLAATPSFADPLYRDGQPETFYRADQPPTLTPAPKPREYDGTEGFGRLYAAHGKPRIVVFWNRELSDNVVTPWVDEIAIGRAGDVYIDRYGASASSATVVQSRTFSEDQSVRGNPMSTAPDWKVQGQYKSAMLRSGATMIDRRAAMRFSKAGQAATVYSNLTAVETKSLAGAADILIEILLARDPDSATGYIFQGTIIRIKDGRMLGSFVTNAQGAAKDLGNRASASGGFERVIVQGSTDQMGSELAKSTLSSLVSAWQ